MNAFRLLPCLLFAFWSAAAAQTHRDLAYRTDGHERQKLDLYLPEKSDRPAPLIIWIHGGGWQGGSKENALPLRQGWVERGYAIASINYRLSGHAVFPAQIEDCKAAIRWLRAHAAQYHIDPTRFGVWGSSAGGHLAALVGTSGDGKTLDVGEHLDQSSRVQAVCDYYGPTDLLAFVSRPGYENHANPRSPESLLLGGAVKEKPELAKAANPLTYITPDDPPFLIVHGDLDPIVPLQQSELLFTALKSAKLSAHFHTIHGAGHGPGFDGPEIIPMVQKFFDLHLAAEKKQIDPTATTTESQSTPAANGPKAGKVPSYDQILERHDANRDGKISREEFRGPPTLFARLDKNKDGLVTRAEHPSPNRPDAKKPE
jgi:acetyl esterase/lipase